MLLPATVGVRSFFFKSRIFCDHGISVVVVVGCGSVFVSSDGSGGIGDVVKSLVEADVSNGCEGSDVSQLVAKMPAKSRDNTIKIEAIRRTDCDLRREMFVFMYSLQLCRSSTATCKKSFYYYILSCERSDVPCSTLYPDKSLYIATIVPDLFLSSDDVLK